MTFRDDRPVCPICPDDRALDPQPGFANRLHCGGCRGVLLPAAELEDIVAQLMGEPWSLDGNATAIARAAVQTCPRCETKMTKHAVFGVEIDRCAAHGIWVPAKSLAMILEAATGVDPFLMEEGPQYEEGGFADKLKAWFGSRHGGPWSPRRPKGD